MEFLRGVADVYSVAPLVNKKQLMCHSIGKLLVGETNLNSKIRKSISMNEEKGQSQ